MKRMHRNRFQLMALGFVLMALSPIAWGQAGDEVKKLPVPAKKELARSEGILKDVFGEDIAQATQAQAKVKLAVTFLDQGEQSKDAGDRYVLFREARNLAARAGDAALAMTAVDKLARSFEVDALELRATTLDVVAVFTDSKEAAKALVDLVLPLIGEAVDQDNYPLARQFGQIAENAAEKAKSIPLVRAVKERNAEALALEKGFARLRPYIDRLQKDPKDGEANLELGKYYGLAKGKWARALPLLAMGSDPALQKQARLDLTRPKAAKDQILVADGWWDLALAEKDPAKLNLQRRAAHWYEQAVVELTGLSRLKAVKRLDQLASRLVVTPVNGGPGPVGEIRKLEGHSEEIRAVAFSADGRFAVSGGLDMTVRVWDLQGKEQIVLKGHTKQIWGVAFHPNNRQVLSASWDTTAKLWDVKSGKEAKTYTHEKDVNGLTLSRDGTMFMTGCDNHTAYLWKTTGEEVRRFSGFSNYVYGSAFSPNGRYVAAGSHDKTMRVFDLATGQEVKKFDGHADPVTSVAFSADSRFVFACGDAAAHKYDIATGKEVGRFEGKTGRVLTLAVSSDGRRLLTAGDDKFVHLWDLTNGKLLHSFAGHGETINSVAFSPDNRRALSAGVDKTIRLWGLPR